MTVPVCPACDHPNEVHNSVGCLWAGDRYPCICLRDRSDIEESA